MCQMYPHKAQSATAPCVRDDASQRMKGEQMEKVPPKGNILSGSNKESQPGWPCDSCVTQSHEMPTLARRAGPCIQLRCSISFSRPGHSSALLVFALERALAERLRLGLPCR